MTRATMSATPTKTTEGEMSQYLAAALAAEDPREEVERFIEVLGGLLVEGVSVDESWLEETSSTFSTAMKERPGPHVAYAAVRVALTVMTYCHSREVVMADGRLATQDGWIEDPLVYLDPSHCIEKDCR